MTDHTPRIKSRRHSLAYRNFVENILKTYQLLEVGLSGISGETEKIDQILKKINIKEGVRGRLPKNCQPKIEASQVEGKDLFKLEMDYRTAQLIRIVFEDAKLENTAVRFHLYAILAVTIWAAFETYLVMVYEELFRERPELLKSSEKNLTFQEAIEHRENILDYLIERQLDKIGHFTLKEHLDYLNSRLKFEFTPKIQKELADYYLVRNIVAHNLGLVQNATRNKIPNAIKIRENQIRVTKTYLETMIKKIEKSVASLDKFVIEKFFNPKRSTQHSFK